MHRYSYGSKRLFSNKRIKKILGIFSISIGVITLLYFFFPLLSYQIFLSSAFAQTDITAPLPQRFVMSSAPSIGGLFSSGISNVTSDYRDARNWFPQVKKPGSSNQKVTEYQFSIPSQKIDHVKVSSVDFDLSKHLVQYFSTSKSPIDHGTSVIFGHSTLPQWFDPKNYMTIFANMHKIKSGDDVVITLNGKDYTYEVFAISIVESNDPNIFAQSYDNSYITIVTCTPPGTIWKRLIVRAALQFQEDKSQ